MGTIFLLFFIDAILENYEMAPESPFIPLFTMALVDNAGADADADGG